jgi:hypothetical protein
VTLLWSIRITTGTRTSTLSYRSRAIMGGGRKASIVGFPLAWHAGRIGVAKCTADRRLSASCRRCSGEPCYGKVEDMIVRVIE